MKEGTASSAGEQPSLSLLSELSSLLILAMWVPGFSAFAVLGLHDNRVVLDN